MNVTPPATPEEPSLGSKTRILVVDDDQICGDATARVLRAAGFEASLAPDHRLALEDLESTRPIDLLITDIVMPERVNGVALSRMAQMRRPELKVIYITAYDIPGVEDEADGPVLRKPIDEGAACRRGRRPLRRPLISFPSSIMGSFAAAGRTPGLQKSKLSRRILQMGSGWACAC